MQSNFEVFTPGGEKHRVCAILPLICFAVGGEAKRLHSFVQVTKKNTSPWVPLDYQSAMNMYVQAGVEAAGWEQCMDWETMATEGFDPKTCLMQLRTEVRHSFRRRSTICISILHLHLLYQFTFFVAAFLHISKCRKKHLYDVLIYLTATFQRPPSHRHAHTHTQPSLPLPLPLPQPDTTDIMSPFI